MNALRSAVVFAWIVLSIVPLGGGLLLCSPFLSSLSLWNWFAVPWLRGVIAGARLIGGVDYRVTGTENLPGRSDMQRVILVSKHQSTWETFFFPSMMPHPLAYVFKKELLRIPVFGWCLGRLEMVHIDRSKRSEAWNKVAQLGSELMDRGKWIIMFPEGTRSERGGKGDYKAGASRLAIATGAVLIPIAVTSGRCWPRRSFSFIPGRIDVSIGPPVSPRGRQAGEIMAEVEHWIETEMRRIDPEAYPAVPADARAQVQEGTRAGADAASDGIPGVASDVPGVASDIPGVASAVTSDADADADADADPEARAKVDGNAGLQSSEDARQRTGASARGADPLNDRRRGGSSGAS